MTQAVEKLLKVAKSYIGTKESPANSNNVVFNTDYYGKAVSGDAYSWCCAFQWDIFRIAGMPDLFYDGNKTAGCTTFMNWAKTTKKGVWSTDAKAVQPGALILYNFTNNKSATATHIGLCSYPYDGTYLYSIEGNTSVTSDDNGGAVMERKRSPNSVIGFFMPNYPADPPPPVPAPTTPTPALNTPSSWAAEAWEWGKDTSICDGTSPQGNATREQVITMLHRFSKQIKKE